MAPALRYKRSPGPWPEPTSYKEGSTGMTDTSPLTRDLRNLGYRFAVTCPLCGGPLDHITNSAPHAHVSMDVRAIAQCAPCNHSFTIEVRVSSNRHAERARRAQLDTMEVHAAKARLELQGAH